MDRIYVVGSAAVFATACATQLPHTAALYARYWLQEPGPVRPVSLLSYERTVAAWQLPPQNPWAPYAKFTLLTALAALFLAAVPASAEVVLNRGNAGGDRQHVGGAAPELRVAPGRQGHRRALSQPAPAASGLERAGRAGFRDRWRHSLRMVPLPITELRTKRDSSALSRSCWSSRTASTLPSGAIVKRIGYKWGIVLGLIVAAIARAHGASVATPNTGDYEGCGVAVIDPWAERLS